MQAFSSEEDTYSEEYGRHAYEIGWIADNQETPQNSWVCTGETFETSEDSVMSPLLVRLLHVTWNGPFVRRAT